METSCPMAMYCFPLIKSLFSLVEFTALSYKPCTVPIKFVPKYSTYIFPPVQVISHYII